MARADVEAARVGGDWMKVMALIKHYTPLLKPRSKLRKNQSHRTDCHRQRRSTPSQVRWRSSSMKRRTGAVWLARGRRHGGRRHAAIRACHV